MAIDYDSGTGLFDKLGPLVGLVNALDTFETGDLEDNLAALEAVLEDTKKYDAIAKSSLLTKWNTYKTTLWSMKQRIATALTQPLMASEMVAAESLARDEVAFLFEQLKRLMIRDSEAILAPTQTSSASDFDGAASGFAGLCYSRDRLSVSGQSFDYRAKPTVSAVCVQNVSAGNEQFEIRGLGPLYPAGSPNWHNAGVRTIVRTSSGESSNNMLVNGGFEKGPVDSFDGWGVTGLTYGTNLFVDTTNKNRGARAARMTAAGSLSQTISRSKLKQYTHYFFVCQAKIAALTTGSAQFGFSSSFGSYAITPDDVGMGTPQLTTSWKYFGFMFGTLEKLTDLTVFLTCGVTGTLYVDEVGLFELIPLADGSEYLVLAGADGNPPDLNEEFTGASSDNDFDANFAHYFARFFNVYVPTGDPGTIDDALGD